MNLELTIKEMIGTTSEVLHHEVRDVPVGMKRERAIRFMLAEVSEKFYQIEQNIYPYDPTR